MLTVLNMSWCLNVCVSNYCIEYELVFNSLNVCVSNCAYCIEYELVFKCVCE